MAEKVMQGEDGISVRFDDRRNASVSDAPASLPDELEPTIALTLPGDLPWKVLINGVPYVRQADSVDEAIAAIRSYQTIAIETGVSLRQAIWLFGLVDGHASLDEEVMPD